LRRGRPLKIIAGLGNPGKKYLGTRHNVGFEVLEELGRHWNVSGWRSRFEAEVAEAQFQGQRLLLLLPQTYMNLSGRSIRSAVDFYKVALPDVLVVCDDLNLETGRLRLKGSGTAGGQNGLKNIIAQLGTTEFARLRVGIGRPPEGMDAVQHVLQAFARSERPIMQEAVYRAARAVESWATQGLAAAMNTFNRAAESD